LSTAFGIAALVLLGLILWFLWRMVRSPLPPEMQEALERKEEAKLGLLREEFSREFSRRTAEEIAKVWQQFQGQIQTTETSVNQRLAEVSDTHAKLREELGKLCETTKQVEQVGRNVASLQELLRAPKMRGGFGEFFLADLLAQIKPEGSDFYSLQYPFSGGERVDAVIRLGSRLVPVDAKFPLEEFRKMGQAVTDSERAECRRRLVHDVKRHIDAIAEKYIRPAEGTFDFALMYIPAENVYYETVIKEEDLGDAKGVFQHAIRRQVIPVSPNSFYAYLQVILMGLRGFAVEKRAQEILAELIRLQQELAALKEDFDRAGKQIKNAADNFDKAERHLARFGDRLEGIETPADPSKGLPLQREESLKEV